MLLFASCTKNERDIESLFQERTNSVVALKYTLQYEEGRQAATAYGMVMDDNGLILVPEFVPSNLPNKQIKDIKILLLGEESEGVSAEYLGADPITELHYIRAPKELLPELTPISIFSKAEVKMGEQVWGIGVIRLSEKFFRPIVLQGHVTLKENTPWEIGVADNAVSHLGSAVFNRSGDFAGMGLKALAVSYGMSTEGKDYNVVLRRANSSELFISSKDLEELTYRNPEERLRQKLPWIGLVGLQPLDRDVAQLYNLEDQGAILLSNIIEDSPADRAGLKPFDIITHINGKKLEKYHNIWDTVTNFLLTMSRIKPGDEIELTAFHEDDHMIHKLTVGEMPTREKEAKRQYFKSLGFTVREFVLSDAIENKLFNMDFSGTIAQFVRPDSPASDAQLFPGDWIKEIDGVEIKTYEDATTKLQSVIDNPITTEVLLLIERKGDTKVLRVKLQ